MSDQDTVPKRAPEIIAFVEQFIEEHGYSPSVREISAALGHAGPGSTQPALRQMIKLGYLRGNPSIARTIRIGHMPLRPRTEAL